MDKIRVLVIDDEEDFLKILQLNLEEAKKYEVFPLSNAKELIATVHRFKPQVILMDLRMPGIGGIEACEMLNNDPLGRGIPIIVVSALGKDIDKNKAYKVGVVDYLVKPVEIDLVISKIEKVVRQKKIKT